jgi:hypothetical protein
VKVEWRPYCVEDGLQCSDNTKGCQDNLTAGPALSFFIDGELVACGGIRVLNTGEAWIIMPETYRAGIKHDYPKKKILVTEFRQKLTETMKIEALYRVFAEARISENFCRALGFEKRNNIFIR